MSWAIYADRNLEIGIIATMTPRALEVVTSIYPDHRLFSASTAITQLLVPVFAGIVPEDVRELLIANYS